ncbi:MAG: HpcH/HpaI aldolase/citrate lyase family protein [Tabrizicola sp.]|nr:HpcH/HpaI aldolase/citrate lyase family protein [Tabrizicola sp.]
MPAPENILKRRLKAGEVTHGLWLGMADAYAAEMAGTAGFDWLLIDGEHAPNDLRSTMAQLAVLERSGTVPVVRLPDGDPVKVKQALDIGAQSLLIPMVDSAEQARMLVQATRYPPQGFRGVGSSLARASRFSAIPDYLATANDQICLILQVESVKGMAALDDILAVDGVDAVFFGPADLAADMGHLGRSDAPAVREAIYEGLRRTRAAGKAAGILATEAEFIDAAKAAGANFVGVGIDVTLFVGALRALAARYRG